MNISKSIRISKLQSKNKMVGQTFNPAGHTFESLDERDKEFLDFFGSLSDREKENKINSLKKSVEICEKNNWGFPFEYNLLKRRGFIER